MSTFKTAYIQANDLGEQLITPKGVVLHVDESFVKYVQSLHAICTSNKLESVAVARSPYSWLPLNLEGELNLNAPRLVVTPDSFWFEDQPKHGRDSVASIPVGLDKLLSWLEDDHLLLIANDDDEFEDYVMSVMRGPASDPEPFPFVKVVEATPPPAKDELMRCALANFAALGDVFTDAPECAASVTAAQNLQILASLLRGDTETVVAGTLMAGSRDVCDVEIRADGSMLVNLPDGFDPADGAWTVVTTAGHVYGMKRISDSDTHDAKWLIDEIEAFYTDLVDGR
jgi:hypothetical protein